MAATHAPSPRGFFDTAMNGFNRLLTVRAGGKEDPGQVPGFLFVRTGRVRRGDQARLLTPAARISRAAVGLAPLGL